MWNCPVYMFRKIACTHPASRYTKFYQIGCVLYTKWKMIISIPGFSQLLRSKLLILSMIKSHVHTVRLRSVCALCSLTSLRCPHVGVLNLWLSKECPVKTDLTVWRHWLIWVCKTCLWFCTYCCAVPLNEPRHEKNCLRGIYFTIQAANNKNTDQTALICTFVVHI